MKKYIILLIITIFAIILISNIDTPKQVTPTLIEVPQKIEVESESKSFYIAKSFDEKIAIFVPKNSKPFLITEINIKTLPALDQQKLSTGIILDENYPLNKFIEDYTS